MSAKGHTIKSDSDQVNLVVLISRADRQRLKVKAAKLGTTIADLVRPGILSAAGSEPPTGLADAPEAQGMGDGATSEPSAS